MGKLILGWIATLIITSLISFGLISFFFADHEYFVVINITTGFFSGVFATFIYILCNMGNIFAAWDKQMKQFFESK